MVWIKTEHKNLVNLNQVFSIYYDKGENKTKACLDSGYYQDVASGNHVEAIWEMMQIETMIDFCLMLKLQKREKNKK